MIFENLIYKLLYWYISAVDRNKEVTFMNYGYHDENEKIDLSSENEINRYPIQLYHLLARKVEVQNKKVVEVGCGRGGGLAYINKTFSPGYALGVDLNSKATQFSNKHFKGHTLSYMQGDAQNLNLANADFDIVLNVESSHRYPKVEKFFDEVYRILKPGGYFLYTDFREKSQMETLRNQLSGYNYRIIDEQVINNQVGKALKLDSDRREDLIRRKVPFFLRKAIRDFSGNEGSPTYNQIVRGDLVYFVFCLQKSEA
jgi:ubiquinone/menaquinone biosynthesis C-methylase UbiE